jgi:pSer/pThr/pTyr-binding forkhead associated (FHA) protein
MSGGNPNRRREGDPRRIVAEERAVERQVPVGAWLLVLTGKLKGTDYRIREGKNVVGSAPGSEIHLQDDTVSAKHAVITCKRTGDATASYSIVDLDSTNGTFHNDSKERLPQGELVDNDTISFGTTRCKFKCT